MTWRDNWLLALPPAARIGPALALALVGGVFLIWLHEHAREGVGRNLAPIVWCAVGIGLLVRPAQPLMVSAAALGMAGLALRGALGVVAGKDVDLWQPADTLRVLLWGLIPFIALPAALGEAIGHRPVLARRLYFTAVALFFIEQGIRRALGAYGGQPSEALTFFMVALVALFAMLVAERTVLTEPSVGAPADAEPSAITTEPSVIRPHRVRYLDEAPPPIAAAMPPPEAPETGPSSA